MPDRRLVVLLRARLGDHFDVRQEQPEEPSQGDHDAHDVHELFHPLQRPAPPAVKDPITHIREYGGMALRNAMANENRPVNRASNASGFPVSQTAARTPIGPPKTGRSR